MDKQALQAKIDESHRKIAKVREELQEQSKVFFAEASKELFITYPDLKNFGWRQYTPYWNDGETCEFSAHVDYPIVNDWDVDYGQPVDEENEDIQEPSDEIVKAVKDFLNVFDEQTLKEMFGDHATIMVDAKGVTTEEYDHD